MITLVGTPSCGNQTHTAGLVKKLCRQVSTTTNGKPVKNFEKLKKDTLLLKIMFIPKKK